MMVARRDVTNFEKNLSFCPTSLSSCSDSDAVKNYFKLAMKILVEDENVAAIVIHSSRYTLLCFISVTERKKKFMRSVPTLCLLRAAAIIK